MSDEDAIDADVDDAPDIEADLDPSALYIFERIRARTSADPDGTQNATSNVWTGSKHLKADTNQVDYMDRHDVAGVVSELIDHGLVLRWHGLLAPATDDNLQAIIECEHESGAPRKLLIAKCNRMRRGDAS